MLWRAFSFSPTRLEGVIRAGCIQEDDDVYRLNLVQWRYLLSLV